MAIDRWVRSLLVGGAAVFVLLLAGVGSGQLTDDPPAVSPYASGGEGARFALTLVDFERGVVAITNVGDATGSFDGFLCQRPSYAAVTTPPLQPGSSVWVATAGAELETPDSVVAVVDVESQLGSLASEDGEMGLYRDESFGSPDSIVSYVEWGSSGHGRSSVAVDAGAWVEGEFVSAAGAAAIGNVDGSPAAAGWATSD